VISANYRARTQGIWRFITIWGIKANAEGWYSIGASFLRKRANDRGIQSTAQKISNRDITSLVDA